MGSVYIAWESLFQVRLEKHLAQPLVSEQLMPREKFKSKAGTWQYCSSILPHPAAILGSHIFRVKDNALLNTFSSCKFVHLLFQSSRFLMFTTWNEFHVNYENYEVYSFILSLPFFIFY